MLARNFLLASLFSFQGADRVSRVPCLLSFVSSGLHSGFPALLSLFSSPVSFPSFRIFVSRSSRCVRSSGFHRFPVQFSATLFSDFFQNQIETLRIRKMLQSNFGGDNRNRTDDPLLARQVLSQLSYTPN